jgi:tetratricopeptide (TPR) repeat protein
MDVEINPKLLDVVQFEAPSTNGKTLQGTIVDSLDDIVPTYLIEVSDASGVPTGFFTRQAQELKTIWKSTEPAVATLPEAQQLFESGILFLQNGLVARAKEHLAQAFSLDRRWAGQLLNAMKPMAESGAFETVIFVYELLIELLPDYELAREALSVMHLNRGVEFARRGLIAKAIDDFDQALMVKPSGATVEGIRKNIGAAYGNLGVLYSEMKQYEQAQRFFQWSLQIDPSEIARKNLALAGIALAAVNRLHAPKEHVFRQPIIAGLTLSQCLNAYGATLAGLGELTEARRTLEAALESDPHNEVARQNLATLSSRDGSLVFAMGMVRLQIESPHQIPPL